MLVGTAAGGAGGLGTEVGESPFYLLKEFASASAPVTVTLASIFEPVVMMAGIVGVTLIVVVL